MAAPINCDSHAAFIFSLKSSSFISTSTFSGNFTSLLYSSKDL